MRVNRAYGRNAVRHSGHAMGRIVTEKLCRAVRVALVAEFGPERNAELRDLLAPIEEAYVASEFGAKNDHWGDDTNDSFALMLAGRQSTAQWVWENRAHRARRAAKETEARALGLGAR